MNINYKNDELIEHMKRGEKVEITKLSDKHIERIEISQSEIEETQRVLLEFMKLTKPLIQWLNENHHPHAMIIIDTDSAQLFEGKIGITTGEFIKD